MHQFEKTGFFFLVLLLGFPVASSARYHFDLTPEISVSQVYDDNIDLVSSGETSDYIFTVSPSITLDMRSEKNHLLLNYAPTLVRYGKEEENNTVRHAGTLTYGRDLTRHLRFDLTDTYIRSEEASETTEGIQGIRNTRNTYQRNTGRVSMEYRFGREDSVSIGYGQSLLKNEDPSVDDGRVQDPFVSMAYWINIKNGLEFNYGYTKADFWRGGGSTAGDDYTGHSAGVTYIYRFTPHTRGTLEYNFTTRDFEGQSEDYKVHEGAVGFSHSFSRELDLSAEVGYLIQDNDRSGNEGGADYDLLLTRQFDRGTWTVGGRGGWNESYLEAERRGFSRYWSVESGVRYRVLESVETHGEGSYRTDKDDTGRKWDSLRGNFGIRWSFMRWFSLSLDYTYSERDDDINTSDYTDNRVMLTLTGARLFRW